MTSALTERLPAWTARASCGTARGDLRAAFLGDTTDPDLVNEAKSHCAVCPVLDECRRYLAAQPSREIPGVWANTAEWEREGRKKHGKGRPPKADAA